MVCEVDKIWDSVLDRDQYKAKRTIFEEGLEEWFCYWHLKLLREFLKLHNIKIEGYSCDRLHKI